MASPRRFGLAGLLAVMVLGAFAAVLPADEREPVREAKRESADEPIDFRRARELFRKKQGGGTLTADEDAYLNRALEARRKGTARPAGRPAGNLVPRETTGLKPISEMTAEDRYKAEDGGLYGGGKNTPPEAHRRAAEAAIASIEPLDRDGKPSRNGRIVFVSISMSNATQEFSRFKRIADNDPAKSRDLTIVDCAQGGQAMAEWAPPDARPWEIAEQRLAAAGVSPQQVQVVWIKLANKGPRGDLKDHGRQLQKDTEAVIRNAKGRFPNLKVAHLSSRIYAGYAANPLNPEPYAYESGYVVRWLIQDQMDGAAGLNHDPARGEVKAPVLLWGPYLWADGTTPRKADGLTYSRDDLARDGTHPSESGRDKVARLMLEFYKRDPLAKGWFADSATARSSRD